jgi:hypothetical protein
MRAPLYTSLVLPFVLFALGACATSPEPALPALTRLSVPPLDYTAELSDKGLIEEQELDFEHDAGAGHGLVGIECSVLSVEAEVALDLTSGLRGFLTPREEARELVQACRDLERANLLTSPRLLLKDGQQGYITVMNQTAYVSGFRLLQEDEALLVDPVVDVCSHGLLLEASASVVPDTESVALDVSLRIADLLQPIAQHEVSLSGGLGTITLQEPTMSWQRLETELQLTGDECLVLITEDVERKGRMLVSLITARTYTGEEVRTADEGGVPLEELFGL